MRSYKGVNRVQYQLVVVNNSDNVGSVCVFQRPAEAAETPNIMSIAWLTKRLYPTSQVRFTWELDYQFVWAETGELKPGVTFDAGQSWQAGLTENNMVTLHCDEYGAYTFQNQTTNANATGSLVIQQDSTIPLNRASAGLGMGGQGVYALQAQPNMTIIFTPHPTYWLTFGEYTQGEVLNTSEIANMTQISFPPNVYSMKAVLGANNVWSVTTAE